MTKETMILKDEDQLLKMREGKNLPFPNNALFYLEQVHMDFDENIFG